MNTTIVITNQIIMQKQGDMNLVVGDLKMIISVTKILSLHLSNLHEAPMIRRA